MSRTLISIITVSRDNLSGLKKSYSSICSQLETDEEFFSLIEWIVIDGYSSDGSVNFLSDIRPIFAYSFKSEIDSGIFQAMNKGVTSSNGRHLIFLNSGDTFYDFFVLRDLVRLCKKYPEYIIAGFVKIIWYGKSKVTNLSPWVCHQSVLLPSKIFKNYCFNEKLKIYGDLDLWRKLTLANKFSPKRIDRIISLFEMGGVGNNPENLFSRLSERRLISKIYQDKEIFFFRYLHTVSLFIIWRLFGRKSYYMMSDITFEIKNFLTRFTKY